MMAIRYMLAATPVVGIVHAYAKTFKQFLELAENLALPPAERVGDDFIVVMVYRQPEPALVLLVLYKAPHFVKFRVLNFAVEYNVVCSFIRLRVVFQVVGVDLLYRCRCFFKTSSTFWVETPNTRAVSRMPLALAAIAIVFSSMPGSQPLLAYSRINVFWGHPLFWHRYLCAPFLCFPCITTFVSLHRGHFTLIVAICFHLPFLTEYTTLNGFVT
jgi:hypothetical protein